MVQAGRERNIECMEALKPTGEQVGAAGQLFTPTCQDEQESRTRLYVQREATKQLAVNQ
jgi:hypothetical protein